MPVTLVRLRTGLPHAALAELYGTARSRRSGRPSSTTQRARRRRPVSARGALRCHFKITQP
ncbi:hypothetical protein [Kitasatospora sp. HPMI-4]|uniref:hypothetical protein n=1 Tax=Kitasatospora sp. HPMI-4 TaxID=3448443 RepID=UPI003F1B94F4